MTPQSHRINAAPRRGSRRQYALIGADLIATVVDEMRTEAARCQTQYEAEMMFRWARAIAVGASDLQP